MLIQDEAGKAKPIVKFIRGPVES